MGGGGGEGEGQEHTVYYQRSVISRSCNSAAMLTLLAIWGGGGLVP